ncbi:hypothetical protein BJX63DRAFT_415269 [Aspergillus granulosus]|uniref:Uncharacterized protein n=1 Tax=Aspergillus granulosus TaxID=176169 RepID=A0ABR4GTG6_9EURO
MDHRWRYCCEIIWERYLHGSCDGGGLGFEIPVDECLVYSGQWTAGSGTSTDYPNRDLDFTAETDPCAAQLNQDQVSCLQDWFQGNNESDVCTPSLERWDVLGESVGAARAPRPGVASSLFMGLIGFLIGTL